MTKKHYEAIETILAEYRPSPDANDHEDAWWLWTKIVDDLADYFAADNPLFQRDKFLAACGVEPTCKDCGYTNCPKQTGGDCTPT
jgi:hypothetical protein